MIKHPLNLVKKKNAMTANITYTLFFTDFITYVSGGGNCRVVDAVKCCHALHFCVLLYFSSPSGRSESLIATSEV
jgi:hypothetical protein